MNNNFNEYIERYDVPDSQRLQMSIIEKSRTLRQEPAPDAGSVASRSRVRSRSLALVSLFSTFKNPIVITTFASLFLFGLTAVFFYQPFNSSRNQGPISVTQVDLDWQEVVLVEDELWLARF